MTAGVKVRMRGSMTGKMTAWLTELDAVVDGMNVRVIGREDARVDARV
jgi:hypothetical protein